MAATAADTEPQKDGADQPSLSKPCPPQDVDLLSVAPDHAPVTGPQASASPGGSSKSPHLKQRSSARLKRKGSPPGAPQVEYATASIQPQASSKRAKVQHGAAKIPLLSSAGEVPKNGTQMADQTSAQIEASDDSDADLLSPGLVRMVGMKTPRTRRAAARRAVQDSLALLEVQDKVTHWPSGDIAFSLQTCIRLEVASAVPGFVTSSLLYHFNGHKQFQLTHV